MANRAERTDDREGKIVEESPVLSELRRRMAEPGPWAMRFRRLAEAIAGTSDAEPEGGAVEGDGLSCEVCESLLDVYVDDALRGRDVQRAYPHVWQHLRACRRCHWAHDLLADTLQQEREGQLPSLPHLAPPRLSFLLRPEDQVQPSQPMEAPWITSLRSRLDGAPFSLAFTLNPLYLRSLLSPPTPVPVRAEEDLVAPSPRLLLTDTVVLGDQQLAVEVTASLIVARPDHLRLQATIASSGLLPGPLWATLIWAGERRSGRVNDWGQVDLGEVSLQALEEALEAGAGEFSLTFEEQTDVEAL